MNEEPVFEQPVADIIVLAQKQKFPQPAILEMEDGTLGYFYPWHSIRERQLNEEINRMCKERRTPSK